MARPCTSTRLGGGSFRSEPFAVRCKRRIGQLLFTLIASILIVSIYICGWYVWRFVYQSDFFRMRQTEILGASPALELEAREWLDRYFASHDRNLPRLNRHMLTAGLTALPRARQAIVRKVFPQTLKIEFSERRPIIIANLEGPCLVDAEGVIVAAVDPGEIRAMGLPILTGMPLMLNRPGDRLEHGRLPEILEAVQVIHDRDPLLQSRIVEWNINGQGDVTAMLGSAAEVRFGTQPPLDLLDKLSTALLLKGSLDKATYIDLRIDRQIVFK